MNKFVIPNLNLIFSHQKSLTTIRVYEKSYGIFITTRTKTSIRYAKEKDREKREREKSKRRYREGGRDKRGRER